MSESSALEGQRSGLDSPATGNVSLAIYGGKATIFLDREVVDRILPSGMDVDRVRVEDHCSEDGGYLLLKAGTEGRVVSPLGEGKQRFRIQGVKTTIDAPSLKRTEVKFAVDGETLSIRLPPPGRAAASRPRKRKASGSGKKTVSRRNMDDKAAVPRLSREGGNQDPLAPLAELKAAIDGLNTAIEAFPGEVVITQDDRTKKIIADYKLAGILA